MDQQSHDKRLLRWTWLLQVSFAIRMLDFRYCDQYLLRSRTSEHRVERARQLFFLINRLQMSSAGADRTIRMASTWTWWDERLDDEASLHLPDPDFDARAVLPSPDEETFPEVENRPLKLPVDNALRKSRQELLQLMRLCLYQAMDDGQTVHEAIKRLWTFFITSMSTNLYLLEWHDGEHVAKKWQMLSEQGQAEFLATFEVDGPAMSRWQRDFELSTVQDPTDRHSEGYLAALNDYFHQPDSLQLSRYGALGTECDSFNNSLLTLLDVFSELVNEEGFKEHCADQLKWFEFIQGWAGLYEEECPICTNAYEIVFEATMIGSKDNLWTSTVFTPVVLQCKHIMCLPCFKTWVQGEMQNHDACPLCRGKIPPRNPQKAYTQELVEEFVRLSYDDFLTPRRYAQSLLKITDTFISKLPSSLRHTPIPDCSMGALNLAIWRYNVLDPTGKTLKTFFNILPSNLGYFENMGDAQSRAALEGFYLARDRLEAYLNGEQERYRNVRKWQLYSRAHSENVAFRVEMTDLLLSYGVAVVTESAENAASAENAVSAAAAEPEGAGSEYAGEEETSD